MPIPVGDGRDEVPNLPHDNVRQTVCSMLEDQIMSDGELLCQFESDDGGGDSASDDGVGDVSVLSPERAALAMERDKFWIPGEVIRVAFLDGEPGVRKEVELYAKIWERYANIVFKFVSEGDAEIRISFDPKRGCWSVLGTDARLETIQTKATMNLAITPSVREELQGVVLHEFGHVLGLIHEHSSPSASIKWNREAVYAHYLELGWKKETVDSNVLKKYDGKTVTQFSEYDPDSIMQYAIPSDHTVDGFCVEWKADLSPTDKRYIAKMYPFYPLRARSASKQGWGDRQMQRSTW